MPVLGDVARYAGWPALRFLALFVYVLLVVQTNGVGAFDMAGKQLQPLFIDACSAFSSQHARREWLDCIVRCPAHASPCELPAPSATTSSLACLLLDRRLCQRRGALASSFVMSSVVPFLPSCCAAADCPVDGTLEPPAAAVPPPPSAHVSLASVIARQHGVNEAPTRRDGHWL